MSFLPDPDDDYETRLARRTYLAVIILFFCLLAIGPVLIVAAGAG